MHHGDPELHRGVVHEVARGEVVGAVDDDVPAGEDVHHVVGTEAHVDPVAAVEALHRRGHELILSEGGPTTFSALVAAGLVDELFLTTSPLLAGRTPGGPRPALVEHAEFLADTIVEGKLLTLKRGGSHLFARYQIAKPKTSGGG